MKKILIDLETKAATDLTKRGIHNYVRCSEFEVLLFGYNFMDGSPTKVVDVKNGENSVINLVTTLGLLDESTLIYAFNVNFEFEALCSYVPELRYSRHRWIDIAAHGAYAGLPAKLSDQLAVLKLGAKHIAGAILIKLFTVPKGDGYDKKFTQLDRGLQAKWLSFKEYCAIDVDQELVLHSKLLEMCPEYPIRMERSIELHTALMNERGVKFDVGFAEWLNTMYQSALIKDKIELNEVTGLANANSPIQFAKWLRTFPTVKLDKVDAASLDKLLKHLNDLPAYKKNAKGVDYSKAIKAIAIKRDIASTIPKKYEAGLKLVGSDGRMHGLFRYYGANRTGRFTSNGYQLHNLARTKEEVSDKLYSMYSSNMSFEDVEEYLDAVGIGKSRVLGQGVRRVVVPAEGHQFVIADFSAIEAVVAAYLAGEQWVLDVFRGDGKIYEQTASRMYDIPIEDIGPESEERRKGKYAVLSLGYEGGVQALKNFGADEFMTEEEMVNVRDSWRHTNSNIVELWGKLLSGFVKAYRSPYSIVEVNKFLAFRYDARQNIMKLGLPSGRSLVYLRPKVEQNYLGVSASYLSSKFGASNLRDSTYGGKLMENVCQAVARDVLVEYILRLEAAGLKVVMHVHDEVAIEVANEDASSALTLAEELGAIAPDWAPDMPLKVVAKLSGHYVK